MSGAQKVLIFGGVALATLGMLYGLYYAVFVEHQTLDQMGGSLSQGFVYAAEQKPAEASTAIDRYAATKYAYVRQVDLHSHWIGLAMLMLVLGAAFDAVAVNDSARRWAAWGLAAGSFLFPLGVILQVSTQGSWFAKGLAVAGSALVIAALAAIAYGFSRQNA